MAKRDGKLQIDGTLRRFVEREALPGTGIESGPLWRGLTGIAEEFAPECRSLLARRQQMQQEIDLWLSKQRHPPEPAAQEAFLREIGYLVAEGADFEIDCDGVDEEIGRLAGPQLVVPVTNTRYLLNAANARWGSLYDALYGTDAIAGDPPKGGFDRERGAKVVQWCRGLLDQTVPLANGSHSDVDSYAVSRGRLTASVNGRAVGLQEPSSLVGWKGPMDSPRAFVLRRHGLHLEIVIDRKHPVGKADRAGVRDVMLESALTAIVDFEDSVAVVDAEDKIAAYRNWLGLMKGGLTATFEKNGKTMTRRQAGDRVYEGGLRLRGRSLLMVRHVGLLLTTPAATDGEGRELPEHLLDAVLSPLIAIHDRCKPTPRRNSPANLMYVVLPKLHGPQEVGYAMRLFGRVEQLLGLPENTIRVGIMDEERRTSVNLGECLRAARSRLAFINTGFLDRTGDDIHTMSALGPVPPKERIKEAKWFQAYERSNVAVGLDCGLPGRAQIGKGMWAMPASMNAMIKTKGKQIAAGASTAWVPSPTAATLHVLHYLETSVSQRQEALRGRKTPLRDLLAPALASSKSLDADSVGRELERNVQSILGYVSRWVDQGVGCSTVPDIDNVGLMEDRATLRISSQHIGNWLRHGVITTRQVDDALRRVAKIVDAQNAGDSNHQPLRPGAAAYRAARALAVNGATQPSGYTEPILHRHRREVKAKWKESAKAGSGRGVSAQAKASTAATGQSGIKSATRRGR